MPLLSPQYAFVAGEVSPEFYGRTDLVKYSLGVGLAENWIVGRRGGMYSRVGGNFVGYLKNDQFDVRLFRFRATDNDYVLVFGDNYVRVVRNGGYILEAASAITGITNADPAVVTHTAHGFNTGDWVYIEDVEGLTEVNGQYFRVGAFTANTYELQFPTGQDFDTTNYDPYTSGGTSSRVFNLSSPYVGDDLAELKVEQELEDSVTVFKLTHPDYKPRKLTYTDDVTWSIDFVDFTPNIPAPTGVTLTPSAAGTSGVAFAVTALVNGKEGLPSPYEITEVTVNYVTGTAGSMKVEWNSVTGATEYNVYRSLMLDTGADISLSQELGYIGRALSTQFIDNNITPDFTKTPPLYLNPFADEAIVSIEVTAGGTGYSKSDTVTIGGGGTGFEGYPVVNAAGEVLSVVIVNPGQDYTSPTVTFNTAGGSGATAVATSGPATGNYPSVYKRFQQRGVYGGSINYPMTVWGSRPGATEDFGISVTLNAGDSYTFELDEAEIQPIKHFVSLRSGLLIFTAERVTQLLAEQGRSISPVDALAEPQLYKGVSAAEPLTIGLDVVFTEQFSNAMNVMVYTEYTQSFKLQNVSVLSDHLIGGGRDIKRMEYAEEPDRLIYSLRSDGVLVTTTYDREEEVFGWAQQTTQGIYHDIVSVQEGNIFKLYYVVERFIDGTWRKYLEVFGERETDLVEDYRGLDSNLTLPQIFPAANLTIPSATGTGVTVTASSSVFAADDVGKFIYAGGGKLEITGYTSGTSITCDILREVTDVLRQGTNPKVKVQASGSWTIAEATDTLGGLWHLEGETLNVLADGDVYLSETVVDGTITIDEPASKITAGLPYFCDMKTLPVISTQDFIEIGRKNIAGMGLRLYRTRGLAVGKDFDDLRELKDLTDEDWGEIINLRDDVTYEELEYEWNTSGEISLRQAYPLPAAVLSITADTSVGDP